jgi:hypothetical protein
MLGIQGGSDLPVPFITTEEWRKRVMLEDRLKPLVNKQFDNYQRGLLTAEDLVLKLASHVDEVTREVYGHDD